MVTPMKFFETGPRGPPAASRGPRQAHETSKTTCTMWLTEITRVQRCIWPTNKTTYAAEMTTACGQPRSARGR